MGNTYSSGTLLIHSTVINNLLSLHTLPKLSLDHIVLTSVIVQQNESELGNPSAKSIGCYCIGGKWKLER
jgi:hypothetical protein